MMTGNFQRGFSTSPSSQYDSFTNDPITDDPLIDDLLAWEFQLPDPSLDTASLLQSLNVLPTPSLTTEWDVFQAG